MGFFSDECVLCHREINAWKGQAWLLSAIYGWSFSISVMVALITKNITIGQLALPIMGTILSTYFYLSFDHWFCDGDDEARF